MNRGLNRFSGPPLPGGFPWADRVHAAGLAAVRPPASWANAGFFYLATDTNGGTLYRSTGTAWVQAAPGVTSGGSGTVTSVATDATLTGGPVTTTGTLGINLSHANTWAAAQTFPNASGVKIQDTDASNTLGLVGGSNLTADRTLTLTTGDASRVLTFTADATIGGTTSGANTGDQTITLTGDVTGAGTGSFAATIAADAVTYAKMQNVSAASKLLGRGSASGAGDPEEITLGTNLSMTGTTLNVTAGSGTVTSVTVTSANGVKVSGGTTQTITGSGTFALTLGDITPTSVAATGAIAGTVSDASNSSITSGGSVGHSLSSGTPVNGIGTSWDFKADDVSNPAQLLGGVHYYWADVTHASRRAVGYVTAVRAGVEVVPIVWGVDSSGNTQVSFHNGTLAARQTGDIAVAMVTYNLMSGTPTLAAANLTGTVATAYVCLRDEKTSGTAGGTFTADGTFKTRTLNTEAADAGGVCSLSSNQFTLLAGTYIIHASAPALAVNGHQAILYNVTDATEQSGTHGTSEVSSSSDVTQTRSVVTGKFTIAASKAFEIRHQAGTTGTTTGFGRAASFGTEVYTVVELWKEAG